MPRINDHETDRIRGILCFKCNVGLGHFNDSEELLQRAVVYLQETNIKQAVLVEQGEA